MRNLSMKKFGTPIGAAPGSAIEKVGLAAVGAPPSVRPGFGLALRAFLRAARSTAPVIFFASTVPTRRFWLRFFSRARVELSGLVVPWVRLGAPRFSLPSGVEVGVGVPGVAVTVGSAGVEVAVGTVTGPLSMTSLIVPVMPGIWSWLTGVPGGMSTWTSTRWPVISTTVTECSSAEAGIAATPRPAVAAISAMMPFRRFILGTRPLTRLAAPNARE